MSLYKFETLWKSGKSHNIADAFSRAPISQPEECKPEEEIKICQIVTKGSKSTEDDPIIMRIKEYAEKDKDYLALMNDITRGFEKAKSKTASYSGLFWNIRDYLSVEDGLVLYGSRIVVPKCGRKEVLQALHASHQGMERTKRRARQVVYWPGIDNDIETTVRACDLCQENQASNQKEPLMQEPFPTRIFMQVSVDFF